MGKAHKKGKASASQKKDKFWSAIRSEKLKDVRGGLSETGAEAHTRNEQGLTTIMLAAALGKDRALDTLLDWYERRRELRRKGWINLSDDDGRTALMMAAFNGHVLCVESLLNKGAATHFKDDKGKTALDLAKARKKEQVVDAIEYFLAETEDEEEGDEETINDGLTSTQRNRLKKRELQALERRGNQEEEQQVKQEVVKEKGPKPIWIEVEEVAKSVEMLRAVHQIAVIRTEESQIGAVEREHFGLDPAIWYQYSVTRLELVVPKGIMTGISGPGLQRMDQLVYLILNNNSITEIPEEIQHCVNLKVLEVASNELVRLPENLNKAKQLEVLNVANNKLTSVAQIDGCSNLATINLCNNELTALDFNLEELTRLHDLLIADNTIAELPSEIGSCTLLETLNGDKNSIVELPLEITELKKLKVLKLEGNPIKDPKVVKMLKREGKGLKELWKYLQKNAKRGKGKGKGKKPKVVEEEPKPIVVEEPKPAETTVEEVEVVTEKVEDLKVDGNESDDSFDIDMDDL